MSPSDQPSSNREERLAELKREAALLERELDGDRGEAAVSTSTKRSSAAQRTVPIDGSSAAAASSPSAAEAGQNSDTQDDTQDDGQGDDTQDGESQDDSDDTILAVLRSAPPWLISFIVHMLLLIVLGIWTMAVVDDSNRTFVIAAIEAEEEQLEMLAEFEAEPIEEMEFQDLAVDSELPDPGEVALGQLLSESTEPIAAEVGQLSLPSSIDNIGALFGDQGQGMAEFGAGFKGAASFFGSKVKGKRFVFVVDNSNSMTKGRLETALAELMHSVQKMDKSQQFYVIFFSDSAYPLFHPKHARNLIPATEENKRKLQYWLESLQMCLQTRGSEACRAAISFRPDAIYILGDGAFTDNATDVLTAPHSRRTVINTLGMEVNERGERQLSAIAKANGGTYRAVAATAAARKSARMNPIKRNRTRGPVWGLKLPK